MFLKGQHCFLKIMNIFADLSVFKSEFTNWGKHFKIVLGSNIWTCSVRPFWRLLDTKPNIYRATHKEWPFRDDCTIWTSSVRPFRRLLDTKPNIYRVTHKEWPFRDDCTEFVKSIFLHSGFFVGQNWLISLLGNLVNHQNTQLMQKSKIKLQLVTFYICWSSLQSNPLWVSIDLDLIQIYNEFLVCPNEGIYSCRRRVYQYIEDDFRFKF